MSLLSRSKTTETRRTRGATQLADPAEVVREARIKARRRLIGAALLLMVGIIGFPLLFETEPRPIAVDMPIVIPSRDGGPAVVAPQASPAGPVASPSADSPASRTSSGTVAATPSTPAPSLPMVTERDDDDTSPPPTRSQPEPVRPAPNPTPAPTPAPTTPPAATRPATPPTSATVSPADEKGRFVVQIGAYADANGARKVRERVEALGMKSYTQVVNTSAGQRIRVRVGPFTSRAEADQAAAKLKISGLTAAILEL